MKFSSNGKLDDLLFEFKKTTSEIKNSWGIIYDSEVITQLLALMPENFQVVTTAIDVVFCQETSNVTLTKITCWWKKQDKLKTMRNVKSHGKYSIVAKIISRRVIITRITEQEIQAELADSHSSAMNTAKKSQVIWLSKIEK